jgi:hypothetical protein
MPRQGTKARRPWTSRSAAREFANYDPTAATPDPKLMRLLHCGTTGIKRGSELISEAVAEASFST